MRSLTIPPIEAVLISSHLTTVTGVDHTYDQLTLLFSTMPRGRRRQYSHDLRDRVISNGKRGLGSRRIGRHLDLPREIVRSIIEFFKKHGHAVVPRRKGRHRLTDGRLDQRLVREGERNRFESAAAVAVVEGHQQTGLLSGLLSRYPGPH